MAADYLAIYLYSVQGTSAQQSGPQAQFRHKHLHAPVGVADRNRALHLHAAF